MSENEQPVPGALDEFAATLSPGELQRFAEALAEFLHHRENGKTADAIMETYLSSESLMWFIKLKCSAKPHAQDWDTAREFPNRYNRPRQQDPETVYRPLINRSA